MTTLFTLSLLKLKIELILFEGQPEYPVTKFLQTNLIFRTPIIFEKF